VRVRDVFDRDARDYDRSRRQLIPCFEDFYDALLAELRFDRDEAFHALDLGAGTGLVAHLIARAFPRAEVTLVDVAGEMLAVARDRLEFASGRLHFVTADYSRLVPSRPFACVVSALSIHHLEPVEKADLFARIHGWLQPGGVFVNADQVAGRTPVEDRRNRQSWLAAVNAGGVSAADLAAALDRMKEDKPSTVAEQLEWLRAAGFDGVACVFERQMFAVMRARKP